MDERPGKPFAMGMPSLAARVLIAGALQPIRPRDLAGKHSRARQPSQGLVFNFGPADSLAQALPPMSPVPIASYAATTAATSKHDARGVLIRIGKQGPGVPRRPGLATGVRPPQTAPDRDAHSGCCGVRIAVRRSGIFWELHP